VPWLADVDLEVLAVEIQALGVDAKDHLARFGEFLREVGPWVAEGKLQHRETVLDGIENVPAAFSGLFRGDNTGKMLVRVGPD